MSSKAVVPEPFERPACPADVVTRGTADAEIEDEPVEAGMLADADVQHAVRYHLRLVPRAGAPVGRAGRGGGASGRRRRSGAGSRSGRRASCRAQAGEHRD